MKKSFKFGFLAFAVSLSVAACNSNKKTGEGADSTKTDATSTTATTDSGSTAKTDTIVKDSTKKDTTLKSTTTTIKKM